MSHKAARREYLEALAQFERSCQNFSSAMSELLEPRASEETMLGALVRKPAKRARDAAPPAPATLRRAA